MSATAWARQGEDIAVRYLERAGLTVVDRNWRCAVGEIDVVCLDGTRLVFCEVKSRRSDRAGTPEAAVDARKRRRLVLLARTYLHRAGLADVAVRFDVVAVDATGDRPVVRHHRDAFSVTD